MKYIKDIKKSIELCDSISAPYLLLLENCNYKLMKKDMLVNRIKKNSLIREVEEKELVEIEVFIQYYICRNILSETEIEYNNIIK